MKKEILILLFAVIIFYQCDVISDFSDITDPREFVFENYTDNEYVGTTISVGEVIGNEIHIHYSETVTQIPQKRNSNYSSISTGKSETWDDYFVDFIKQPEDLGCFLIEFSDGRKLFVLVEYDDFPGTQISAANLFIVKITDTSVYTLLQESEINDIPVGDYKIVKN